MRTFICLLLACLLTGCISPHSVQPTTPTPVHIIRMQLVFETDHPEEVLTILDAIDALRYSEKLFGRANVYFAIDSIKTLSRSDYDSIDNLFYSAKLDESVYTIFFLAPQGDYLGIAGLTIIPYSDWGAGTIIFGQMPNRIIAHEIGHFFGLEHFWEDDFTDTVGEKYSSTNVMDYSPTQDENVTISEQQLDYIVWAINKYHQKKLIR